MKFRTSSRSTILRSLAATAAVAAFAMPLAALADTELRFRSGNSWRGELNSQVEVVFVEGGREQRLEGTLVRADTTMLVVEAMQGGRPSRKTIFFGDVRSMRTLDAVAPVAGAATGAGGGAGGGSGATEASPGSAEGAERRDDGDRPLPPGYQGVIVLPMEGMVGLGMRDEHLTAIGEVADKIGPGQIIVLEINSGGGSIIEAGKIHLAMKELRKRHRVVAWIKEAISAAAFTAFHCDEIYFMTVGTMGSMTGFNSGTGQSLTGEPLNAWLDLASRVAADNGYDPNMARAMILKDLESSVDIPDGATPKDAVWRSDAKGQIVVDTKDTMLCFNASTALAVGVSSGTADTTEELAKLLDLPEWKEASDAGRRMHADWMRLVKLSESELPKLMARFQFKGEGSGDPAVIIGSRIQVIEELLRWRERCPECCDMRGIPPKEELRTFIDELRRDLAQVRRNNRGGGAGR